LENQTNYEEVMPMTNRWMLGLLVVGAVLVGACGAPAKPTGTLDAAELLADPRYEAEVRVYGQVSALGELLCPCFMLSSGGETLDVWYGLMVEDDGTERPPVSVEGIENGDWVVVTGELKWSDGQLPSKTFWATHIEKAR
jgi:hypothetical protein